MGSSRITDRSDKALKIFGVEVKARLKELSEDALAIAKQPDVTPRDTGNLADSIELVEAAAMTYRLETQSARASGAPGYGYFVHQGTDRMPGRPYLMVAVERAFRDFGAKLR